MDTETIHASSSDGNEMNGDEQVTHPESSERIDVPSENDVLCGRGGSINSHKGNERFRELVEKRKRVYLTARFKREKRLIASSIVSEIRSLDPPGRFLARKGNKDSGYWHDIGDEKARDKTSQALRENAPSIRAEIETEINQQRAEMKRKGAEEQAKVAAAAPAQPYPPQPQGYYPGQHPGHPGPYPPPPPQHGQQHQAYWDWYHRYYGYPPHAPPPHGPPHAPPPPHAAAHPPPHMPPPFPHPVAAPAPAAVPTAPPTPPPSFWGPQIVPMPAQRKSGEEFKEDDNMMSPEAQQIKDQHMAMELQQAENEAAYKARKEYYDTHRPHRSVSFVSLGSTPSAMQLAQQPQTSPKSPSFHPVATDDAALSQEERDHRLAVALQEEEDNVIRYQLQAGGHSSRGTSRSSAAYKSLEQVVPASFVAWVTQDTGLKPKAGTPRRSVQFNEEASKGEHSQSSGSFKLGRQSSAASAESRPLQPQAEPNNSLLSQVAHHILGSWENPTPQEIQQPAAPVSQQYEQQDQMEAEGLEVQLLDTRDETSMPTNGNSAVQIDWPSRVGSCHAWIPETLGAAWGGSAAALTENSGIHTVNSLEMDVSGNQESVGGGSLCQLFEQDESLQRALREVPSWERSMRSRSPSSFASGDIADASYVRVRDLKPALRPPPVTDTTSGEMDWD